MDLASLKTKNNTEEQRFMLQLDDAEAFIDYKTAKSGDLYLIHTEVPDEMEGQGVGHKLVRESLEIIDRDDLRIIPLCPFIKSYLKDHMEDYKHLLSERAKL